MILLKESIRSLLIDLLQHLIQLSILSILPNFYFWCMQCTNDTISTRHVSWLITILHEISITRFNVIFHWQFIIYFLFILIFFFHLSPQILLLILLLLLHLLLLHSFIFLLVITFLLPAKKDIA
jgi:hypothetical protein